APHLVDQISAETVQPNTLALWWLGQASFVVKGATATIYVDPYLRLAARRLTPPPFPPSAVTNADLVILTHDHGDHVDPETLPDLAAASPGARFVAPRPIASRVADLVGGANRVFPAVADEPLHFDLRGTPVELLPVPAKHEEFDQTEQGYPYLGYTIRLNGVCLHHSGDTIPYEGQIERVKGHEVDVALLPINGRDFYRTRAGTIGNFDYREAAEFAVQIGASVVIPMHYAMFRNNTVPPGHFVSYLSEYFPGQSAHVMGRFAKYVHVKTSSKIPAAPMPEPMHMVTMP
ncbi:MAG TPA: MBL fold metallo-hydrolase, partial [Chloroflexota bacterium]|nr:MBL fold metallo-hydrolase [Chloroflexota bacterium]